MESKNLNRCQPSISCCCPQFVGVEAEGGLCSLKVEDLSVERGGLIAARCVLRKHMVSDRYCDAEEVGLCSCELCWCTKRCIYCNLVFQSEGGMYNEHS